MKYYVLKKGWIRVQRQIITDVYLEAFLKDNPDYHVESGPYSTWENAVAATPGHRSK